LKQEISKQQRSDLFQRLGLFIAGIGILILVLSWGNFYLKSSLFLVISLGAILIGTAIYSIRAYLSIPEGIKNNGIFMAVLLMPRGNSAS